MKRLARALFLGLTRVLVLGIVALAVVWAFLPWPVTLRWNDPDSTPLMRQRAREARERGDSLALRHEWVPLSRMAPALVAAVITAEDGRFRDHHGVDWEALGEELDYDGEPPFSLLDPADRAALGRAVRYAVAHRGEVRGRSTITQQLAKNLYFTPERSPLRKVAELFVAQRLEWILSKDRILELYLNTVELGPGLFGAEAAAREYFGVSAAELSRWQAATLAATLPHPLTSNPETRPGRMAWRRDLILRYMDGGDVARIPDAPPEPDLPELDPSVLDTGALVPDTLTPATLTPDTLAADTLDTAGGVRR
jgi:monofunctional biosynthetic peptidoglycan transglycosylase